MQDVPQRWRAFDASPVTHSVAHHLMAIAALRDARGYARVTDVAERLGLTRGSVSLTLKGLKSRGLVAQDERRFLQLTESGRALVDGIRAKQVIVARFINEVLGVGAETAATDACKIEHLLSEETAMAMLRQLRASRGDPVDDCSGSVDTCSSCDERCLEQLLVEDE